MMFVFRLWLSLLLLTILFPGLVSADDREELYRQRIAEDSTDFVSWYNLGCILALDNRPDEAMECILKSVELGYVRFEHLKVNDPDLAVLREDPAFESRVDAAVEQRQSALRAELENHPWRAREVQFALAVLAAEQDKKREALQALEAALNAGYQDFAALWNSSSFRKYQSDDAFNAMVNNAYERTFGWKNTPEQKVWGLMQVWAEAKANFAFFDQVPMLDWDKTCRDYIPLVQSCQTVEEYYFMLQELVALLQDGHTSVYMPSGIRDSQSYLPLEVVWIGNRLFVQTVGATDELEASGLKPGMEIVEIDGLPVEQVYSQRVARRYCFGRPGATRALAMPKLTEGPEEETVTLAWTDFSNQVRRATLTRGMVLSDSTRFRFAYARTAPYARFKTLDDNIVYCSLESFNHSRVVDEFRAVFDTLDLSACGGFILDIRTNTGGNSGNGWRIAECFLQEATAAAKWKSRRYIPAYRAWGRDEGWHDGGQMSTLNPAEGGTYDGPLVVLTGPCTFSAAEDFVVPLDHSNRAVLVGDSTGGSTGQPLFVTLPGGGGLRVCTIRSVYPDEKEFVGTGIGPDVLIYPSPEDLRAGRDAVLEKAVEVVRNWDSYRSP